MAKDYCSYHELSDDEKYLLWAERNFKTSWLLNHFVANDCDSFASLTLLNEIIIYFTPYDDAIQDYTGTYMGYCTRSKNGIMKISFEDKAMEFGASVDRIKKLYLCLEKANCISIYNTNEINDTLEICDLTHLTLNVDTLRNISLTYKKS